MDVPDSRSQLVYTAHSPVPELALLCIHTQRLTLRLHRTAKAYLAFTSTATVCLLVAEPIDSAIW